jgi:hypothetical protein
MKTATKKMGSRERGVRINQELERFQRMFIEAKRAGDADGLMVARSRLRGWSRRWNQPTHPWTLEG